MAVQFYCVICMSPPSNLLMSLGERTIALGSKVAGLNLSGALGYWDSQQKFGTKLPLSFIGIIHKYSHHLVLSGQNWRKVAYDMDVNMFTNSK